MGKSREFLLDPASNACEVSLYECSADLLNDEEVVLHCVSLDGRNLEWAAHEMKNDYEVVLAAVSCPTQYNGSSLQHASDSMKDNKDVVMAAIAGYDGQALGHASKRLKGDAGVVRAAMTQSGPNRKPCALTSSTLILMKAMCRERNKRST